MQLMLNLLLAVQILTALVMIGLVLIQHGKGADMGASFGGGSSGSLFGATGSANFLSRATAVSATVFFLCTLALAYYGVGRAAPGGEGGSPLDRPAIAASAVVPGASAPATIPDAAGAASSPNAPSAPTEAAAASVPAPSASAQIPGR